MTLHDFIKRNRDELDSAIIAARCRRTVQLDDDDRRLWVLNDEGLYNWARSEGVDI